MATYLYIIDGGIKKLNNAEQNVVIARQEAERRFGKSGELYRKVPDKK